jgi:hypothetical protein
MEFEPPLKTEKQDAPTWPQPEQEFVSAIPSSLSQPEEPPVARFILRTRKRGFWHYIGLLIAGLCCYAVIIMLAALIWGYIVYSQQGYISGEGWLPTYLYLSAIFFSSCLITTLGRGGAIFPALLFTLLANAISFLLAELSLPPLNGILIKLGLSLLSAMAGFTLSKLLIINRLYRRLL